MQQASRYRAAGAAGALALLFVALSLLSTRTAPGVFVNSWLRDLVTNGMSPDMRRALDQLARPSILVVLAPLVLGLVLLAVARGRWRQAAAAAFVAVVPSLLAFAVRSQEIVGGPGGAFPSNHATIGLALLVAVVLAWPVRVVGWGVFVGAVVALCILVGNVSWYAHDPRDVLGSVLLVAAVTSLAVAMLGTDAANVRLRPASSGQR